MAARRNSESGNAFFIVMVSVVLFAALMFAFSRGARQGSENMSARQTEIAATELIGIAQRYQRAVSRLRLKGCSESQISFDDHNDTILKADGTPYNFSNAASPADFSCHFFDSRGAGIVPYRLPADYTVDESLVNAGELHPQSPFFTSTRIAGTEQDSGAAGTELVLWMGRVTKNICAEINDRLGVANPGGDPPVDTWDCNGDLPFQGAFETCTDAVGDGIADLAGRDAFCVAYDASGWKYIFMNVLIAR